MEIESTEISPIVMATLTKFLNEKFDSKNYVLNIELACQKGDNYMGIVYRITASTPDSLDGDIHLIVKVPPKNPLRRQQFFARPGFLREIQAYEEVRKQNHEIL